MLGSAAPANRSCGGRRLSEQHEPANGVGFPPDESERVARGGDIGRGSISSTSENPPNSFAGRFGASERLPVWARAAGDLLFVHGGARGVMSGTW